MLQTSANRAVCSPIVRHLSKLASRTLLFPITRTEREEFQFPIQPGRRGQTVQHFRRVSSIHSAAKRSDGPSSRFIPSYCRSWFSRIVRCPHEVRSSAVSLGCKGPERWSPRLTIKSGLLRDIIWNRAENLKIPMNVSDDNQFHCCNVGQERWR